MTVSMPCTQTKLKADFRPKTRLFWFSITILHGPIQVSLAYINMSRLHNSIKHMFVRLSTSSENHFFSYHFFSNHFFSYHFAAPSVIALPTTLFVPRMFHYHAVYRRSSPISAPFQRNWTPCSWMSWATSLSFSPVTYM